MNAVGFAIQDEDNLREALRYSATLLGELRTPTLTPQRYYELYMQAFNELTHLQVGSSSDHLSLMPSKSAMPSKAQADHALHQMPFLQQSAHCPLHHTAKLEILRLARCI